ncbi:MAG: hypothetical protein ACWGON_05130, partial [Gemmatimonadota bacterium]
MKQQQTGPAAAGKGAGRPSMPWIGRAVLVAGLLLIIALAIRLGGSNVASQASTVPVVAVPAPAPPVSVYDTLGSGETLGELLTANGLSASRTYSLTQVMRDYKSPRSLRAGLVAR